MGEQPMSRHGRANMRRRWMRTVLASLMIAGLPLGVPLAHSQDKPIVWRMATEYPATSMPGQGLSTFAQEVSAHSGGAIEAHPSFDASAGIKSARMPQAVRDGQVEVGDAFGGALGDTHALFLLSSLPFVATSVAQAHRLADLARADYARVFAEQGQHLLYVTPWPPTGLWSRTPVATLDDLHALSVRTYDKTSTDVMHSAGARAEKLSFADTMPRLKDGSINAVLSSGDGGAGRKLWDDLPNFTAIGYAMPLSFTTLNAAAYQALTPAQREAVDAAAQATERQQWARLATRLDENLARMRAHGMTIRDTAPPAVQQALQRAGRSAVTEWRARVGERGAAILDAFQREPSSAEAAVPVAQ